MFARTLAALTLSLSLGACGADTPLSLPGQAVYVSDAEHLKTKVDLLFVVDDSASMSPKVDQLKLRFPAFITQLDGFATSGHPASYHIGVVTSSLGAPGFSDRACSNLGAKLQKRGLATTNTPGCVGPTDSNFLVYDQLNHGNDNTPTGQTVGDTLNCMASVVDPIHSPSAAIPHYGCGFESQLEAGFKALSDTTITENAGFLRPDALLAVVWLTDEDDCSADADSTAFSDPTLGPVNSYRCARAGIYCDGMLLPAGVQASFANCTPATPAQGSTLTDLSRYVTYFTSPITAGGVKADPRDVLLSAIAAPSTPIGTMAVTGESSCGTNVDGTPDHGTCTNIDHSCVSTTDPSFFGDPAVRLNYVVAQAKHNDLTSVCSGDYSPALADIANKIELALQPECITSALGTVAATGGTRPDCTVTQFSGNTTPGTVIPYCADAAGATPCWQAVASTSCAAVCNTQTGTTQSIGITIDRNGAAAPDGASTQILCNTAPAGTKTCN